MITKRDEFQSQKLKNFQTKNQIFRAKYEITFFLKLGEKQNFRAENEGGGKQTKMEIEKNGLEWVNNVQKIGYTQAKKLLKFQKKEA